MYAQKNSEKNIKAEKLFVEKYRSGMSENTIVTFK